MLLVIMTNIVTIRERGKWMGVILMQYAVGTLVGPIIGGAFVQNVSWVSPIPQCRCRATKVLLFSAGSFGSYSQFVEYDS